MHRIIPNAVALALLLPCAFASPAAAKVKIVDVFCDDDDSINRALEKKDEELIVNIFGICVEDVVVRRDRVTLRGADPTSDGIRAATTTDPYGAALLVRGARDINIENLMLTGGRNSGLRIEDSRRNVNVTNCRLEGNQELGLSISAGLSLLRDVVVTGNGFVGAGVSESGVLVCVNCTIEDNPGPGQGFGILTTIASQVQLFGGTLSAGTALTASASGSAVLHDIALSGGTAIRAQGNGEVIMNRGSLAGAISLASDSQATLSSVSQGASSVTHRVLGGSLLTLDGSSTIAGSIALAEFGRAVFRPGATLGQLTCASGADAVCGAGVTKTSSTCGSCP